MMKLDPESANLFPLTVFEHYGGRLIQRKGSNQAFGVERGMKVKLDVPDPFCVTKVRRAEAGSSVVMRLSNPEGPGVHFHCQQHRPRGCAILCIPAVPHSSIKHLLSTDSMHARGWGRGWQGATEEHLGLGVLAAYS